MATESIGGGATGRQTNKIPLMTEVELMEDDINRYLRQILPSEVGTSERMQMLFINKMRC